MIENNLDQLKENNGNSDNNLKEKVKSKVGVIQIVKETRKLFSKCIGILFVFVIMFAVLRDVIFFPVSRKLWSLSLLTVKEGYISDQNIMAVFTHPLVLLAGLFAVVGFCFICLLETSGISMIMEYSYRGDAVKLLSVFKMSFLQIEHCLKPRNIMIFVYLVLIQPFIDRNFASQMLSDITIPEFIMDYIQARISLLMLLLVVYIFIFTIFIRYLFIPTIMILEKKDFKNAAEKSVRYLKGRYISTYIKILFASFIGSIIFIMVPFVILYFVQSVCTLIYSDSMYVFEIGEYIFSNALSVVLDALRTVFMKMFVAAMVLVTYHIFEKQFGDESEINLPDECIKTEGKIHTFKAFVYSVYVFIFAAAVLLFMWFVKMSKWDPDMMNDIINPTKIAAHKGYSSKAPENTLPAFNLAAECDVVDYIELDVRETKDGVPVVIHDASLLAATGENILVYDINFDDLMKLNATYGHTDEEFSETKISKLDDVLREHYKDTDFIIEIKASSKTSELPKKIVELMEKYEITETSVIHSGSYESLKAVKEINPNIECGFIIAVSTGGYADLPYADFFSVEHTYISDKMISQIHQRNKEVYVWTVNEKASFEQVRNMGADVLITDYPEDAYEGIHQYDGDLIRKLSESFDDMSDYENIENKLNEESIEYNGTGD